MQNIDCDFFLNYYSFFYYLELLQMYCSKTIVVQAIYHLLLHRDGSFMRNKYKMIFCKNSSDPPALLPAADYLHAYTLLLKRISQHQ